MIDWLYELSVVMMAVVVTAATLLTSLLIHALVQWGARGQRLQAFKAISPVMLTPLAVVFGLLVGFLTNQVWSDARQAHAAVTREASALRSILVLADTFPDAARAPLYTLVQSHVQVAVEDEWPAMAAHQASWDMLRRDDAAGLKYALTLAPDSGAQQIAQQSLVRAWQEAQDARRMRIVISQARINGVKWAVLCTLAVLILITIALVHSDNRLSSALALALFGLGVSACLTLIASHNHPFTGEISVSPALLTQAIAPSS